MLSAITNKLRGLMNMKAIMILGVSLVFIGISMYVYYTYVEPRLNPSYVENKEFIENTTTKEAELFFFFTEWCPYCKKAKPIWNSLKAEYPDGIINNTKVYFKEVDCDKNEDMANEYKIEGYPTIKLVKDGQVIEYDAKPNLKTLEEFLHTTL